jgi:hypothetical protein
MPGSYQIANEFRRDLDQIASMIGLRTSVSLQLDAERQVVRVSAGDHSKYCDEAVAFARKCYRVPLPADADVVISNAYPMDLSRTFMRSKGILPLLQAGRRASPVVIAACPDGIGHHGLYPFINGHRWQRRLDLARKFRAHPRDMTAKLADRMSFVRSHPNSGHAEPVTARPPIWLYAPGTAAGLPDAIPGMTALGDWDQVLRQIQREQDGRQNLTCTVYPCAPLQVLGGS